MIKLISEIIYDVRDAKTEEEKIKLLQKNRSTALVQLMKFAFLDKYPKVETIPEYTPDDSPIGFSYSKLIREYRVVPFFFEKKEGLQYKKQQQKLKLMLESLHWTESALLENILKKDTSSFGFDLNILKKSFIGEFD
jgi:hypothetical protein